MPPDIMDTWVSGGKLKITVYYASTAPPEINAAIVALVKELSYAQTGQALNFETTEEILGPDTLGNQIALRDLCGRSSPFSFYWWKSLTLASLIAVEIEQGTARALLVTPLRTSQLFIVKGLRGV